MDSQQVLQYMKRLPGVAGIFVVNAAGQTLCAEVPPMFDDVVVTGMATDGINALETLRAEQPDFYELRIDFDLMSVLIRDLDGAMMFVLIDQQEEVSSIRIAANVTSKRYQGESSAPLTSADSASPLGGLSLSPAKKEEKPKPEKKKKDSGGSIWG